MSHNDFETEAKFSISSEQASEILKFLNKNGEYKFERLEKNTFFDTSKNSLQKSGKSFRIRSEKNLKNHKTITTMTLKGKKNKNSKFKSRKEFEIAFENSAETAKGIALGLGLKESISFDKLRKSYQFQQCSVEIDKLPLIGYFCEIEGSEKNIEKVQRIFSGFGLVDFAKNKLINKGYAQLIAKEVKKQKMTISYITFK